ncbi:unnamed protein product [Owenia fusiformis]|uniref:Uncharacterized protein n=1 Tax=Owenia fusiformis TaxID=6347 RepID=A0A8J1XTJ9_OWEFU|nr:unnamed protein product [Owenia fusiformis]
MVRVRTNHPSDTLLAARPTTTSSLLATGLAFLIMGLIISIIALSTPYWQQAEVHGNMVYNMGLWEFCISGSRCVWVFNDNHLIQSYFQVWYRAFQGLYTSAVIVALATTITAAITLCPIYNTKIIKIVVASLSMFSFLLIVSAVTIFMTKFSYAFHSDQESSPVKMSWSFYLALSGSFFLLIPGFMFLCATPTDFCQTNTKDDKRLLADDKSI